MNRRSLSAMTKPCATGAVCALTAGTKIGVPMVDTSIAIVVAIDHAFRTTTRRHVTSLYALMTATSPLFRSTTVDFLKAHHGSSSISPPCFRACPDGCGHTSGPAARVKRSHATPPSRGGESQVDYRIVERVIGVEREASDRRRWATDVARSRRRAR